MATNRGSGPTQSPPRGGRDHVGTLGDFKSETRATSARNAGRRFPGIAGDFTPEFARRRRQSHPMPPGLSQLCRGWRAHIRCRTNFAACWRASSGRPSSAAADYAADAIAPAMRAAYIRDWEVFTTWCREQWAMLMLCQPTPCWSPPTSPALPGRSARAPLRGRLAAIAYHHRRRGLTWSGAHLAIRETLAGIGRAHGKPVRRSAALTSVEVKPEAWGGRDPSPWRSWPSNSTS